MATAGKAAIVTGAGRGIGRGCALRLARDGLAVAVWDVDAGGAKETVALIHKEGHRAIACVGDAADSTAIAAMLGRIRAELGPVLVLVNNAAVVQFLPFLEIAEKDVERLCRNNLIGPFLLTQAVLPDMQAAGWGRIINFSSAAAQQGTKLLSHYAATKGGIAAMTRTLAMEFAAQGITANAVSPSCIDTPMRLEAPPADFAAVVAGTPMKRSGQPEDIAAAVSFLASDGASYITGQVLSVNGGLVLA
ncbi:MAG: SDR family NAD(P)-dependent oxidoreductase [Novosphingobium sp.]